MQRLAGAAAGTECTAGAAELHSNFVVLEGEHPAGKFCSRSRVPSFPTPAQRPTPINFAAIRSYSASLCVSQGQVQQAADLSTDMRTPLVCFLLCA